MIRVARHARLLAAQDQIRRAYENRRSAALERLMTEAGVTRLADLSPAEQAAMRAQACDEADRG